MIKLILNKNIRICFTWIEQLNWTNFLFIFHFEEKTWKLIRWEKKNRRHFFFRHFKANHHFYISLFFKALFFSCFPHLIEEILFLFDISRRVFCFFLLDWNKYLLDDDLVWKEMKEHWIDIIDWNILKKISFELSLEEIHQRNEKNFFFLIFFMIDYSSTWRFQIQK